MYRAVARADMYARCLHQTASARSVQLQNCFYSLCHVFVCQDVTGARSNGIPMEFDISELYQNFIYYYNGCQHNKLHINKPMLLY
jgi:hypothetical protein